MESLVGDFKMVIDSVKGISSKDINEKLESQEKFIKQQLAQQKDRIEDNSDKIVQEMQRASKQSDSIRLEINEIREKLLGM